VRVSVGIDTQESTDVQREILVTSTPQESRVSIIEDGRLVERRLDRPDQGRLLGDIYLGRVEAVIPGIQAAFVDIGTDKAGFLHVSDLGRDDEDDDEEDDGKGSGGRRNNRKGPPIQDQLRKGQSLLVQVTKEPIGTKGPRLTAQLSLPGRLLVYIPDSDHIGVSRKIDDREERSRLRAMVRAIVPEDSGGVIVRTVGEEVHEEELKAEFESLHGTWRKIQSKAKSAKAPELVHAEAKMVSGVIRDLFSDKFDALRLDSKELHDEIAEYVRSIAPDLLDRLHLHEGEESLFDEHGVEEEIQRAFRRTVELPSGGHVVIEPTEALVAVDVNTGRFTGKKDPEHTILKTNLDAARELAKQLRLRDIGGIIVVDFIDMDSAENRARVLHELRSHLGRDRARTKTFEISELGLVEMTRQRVRPSIFQSLTEVCEHCGGMGRVYSPQTVVRRIERTVKRASGSEDTIIIRAHPQVVLRILEKEPHFLERLRRRTGLDLSLVDDPLLREDEFRLLAGPAKTDVTDSYVSG